MGLKKGEYDNGWFLDHLKEFLKNGPYNLDLTSPIAVPQGLSLKNGSLSVIATTMGSMVHLQGNFPVQGSMTIRLVSPTGKIVATLFDGTPTAKNWSATVPAITCGVYFVEAKSATNHFVQRITVHR